MGIVMLLLLGHNCILSTNFRVIETVLVIIPFIFALTTCIRKYSCKGLPMHTACSVHTECTLSCVHTKYALEYTESKCAWYPSTRQHWYLSHHMQVVKELSMHILYIYSIGINLQCGHDQCTLFVVQGGSGSRAQTCNQGTVVLLVTNTTLANTITRARLGASTSLWNQPLHVIIYSHQKEISVNSSIVNSTKSEK